MSLTGSFKLLPHELLLQLTTLLPIADVLSLNLATYNSMHILSKRIDPAEYLKSAGPFQNASDLLEVMAQHGAVLSGSRALDYFVPGSTTSTSDWDFYVPPVFTSVFAVKQALEQSGVKFQSCLTQVVRKLSIQSSVILTRNQIMSIAHEANHCQQEHSSKERVVIEAIFAKYPLLQETESFIREDGSALWIEDIGPIMLDEGGRVSPIAPHEAFGSRYPTSVAAKVLYGTAQKQDTTVSVQLVVGSVDPRKLFMAEPLSRTVFKSIFSFYASHVQCILTKHVAFHMYYKLALQQSAYKWSVPEAIREKAEAAIQKYVSRGFTFRTVPEDNAGHRSALDDGSLLIELSQRSAYHPPLSQIKAMRWCHHDETTRLLINDSAVHARHRLLDFGIFSI